MNKGNGRHLAFFLKRISGMIKKIERAKETDFIQKHTLSVNLYISSLNFVLFAFIMIGCFFLAHGSLYPSLYLFIYFFMRARWVMTIQDLNMLVSSTGKAENTHRGNNHVIWFWTIACSWESAEGISKKDFKKERRSSYGPFSLFIFFFLPPFCCLHWSRNCLRPSCHLTTVKTNAS